ncbi:coproporphyrinogen III oxidase, partial [Xanthomonas campestris pv. campestris]|nr:coproporphyrinogen III oxidase [Xanthomonas campestris pv. campestris]MCF8803453.1 coproporphyrinogen III oxidase [Xanthomonas campestris pv. campestris]MCF8807639.1 coproporphyrinogen III oxidase [Xanthomonas campestris pv. campestris]MCF8849077.1 coproporphyrinogen III oxidase [Xanthomonas campestris pv. campestris]MCF8853205.1 coproporphyrinogen III oxidase [Xanthomonas campestris pv. campestris]
AQRHQCDARHCYDDALAALEVLTADGLVEVRGLCVDVTATGWPLVRLAAMCFDRYLQPSQQAVRYSKAI